MQKKKLNDVIFEDRILLGMKFRQINNTNDNLAIGWNSVKTQTQCAWQNGEFPQNDACVHAVLPGTTRAFMMSAGNDACVHVVLAGNGACVHVVFCREQHVRSCCSARNDACVHVVLPGTTRAFMLFCQERRVRSCCSARNDACVHVVRPGTDEIYNDEEWNSQEDQNSKLEYRKGTSIRQAPIFRHLRALRKNPWKFINCMNEL